MQICHKIKILCHKQKVAGPTGNLKEHETSNMAELLSQMAEMYSWVHKDCDGLCDGMACDKATVPYMTADDWRKHTMSHRMCGVSLRKYAYYVLLTIVI